MATGLKLLDGDTRGSQGYRVPRGKGGIGVRAHCVSEEFTQRFVKPVPFVSDPSQLYGERLELALLLPASLCGSSEAPFAWH